jgi:hypothetical protein
MLMAMAYGTSSSSCSNCVATNYHPQVAVGSLRNWCNSNEDCQGKIRKGNGWMRRNKKEDMDMQVLVRHVKHDYTPVTTRR